MDDSRGRALQSFVDPIADVDGNRSHIRDYKPGTIPTQIQCEHVLERWLAFHDLDDEQSKDKVWQTLSLMAKRKPLDEDDELVAWRNSLDEDEVVDFSSMKFEVYKVLRLGGGASSREAHSRLYRRTTRSCNIFLRYQSFQDIVEPDAEGDAKFDYENLLEGHLQFGVKNRRGTPVEVITLIKILNMRCFQPISIFTSSYIS